MAVDWHVLTAQVDQTVDDTMGQAIMLIPWTKLPYQMGAPDPDREPRTTVGIFKSPTVVIGNVSGVRAAETDVRVQVRSVNVGDIRQYDHVRFLDPHTPGGEYEITFVDPGNIRHTLHLIKVKDLPS